MDRINTPKTIQIFLPDGSPRSIRIAEITSRVVKVFRFQELNLMMLDKDKR